MRDLSEIARQKFCVAGIEGFSASEVYRAGHIKLYNTDIYLLALTKLDLRFLSN